MKNQANIAYNRELFLKGKKLALFTLLCLLTHGLLFFSTAQAEKNVLLLMVDDLNDWVGALGGHPQAKTPNIDKLAKKGVIFRNAHASGSVCSPSRTSMLTGMRPSTSGFYSNGIPIFRETPKYANIVTLPQVFKKKGYFCVQGGKIFPDGDKDTLSFHEINTKNAARESPNPYPHGMNLAGGVDLQWGYSADTTAEMTDQWKTAKFIADYIKNPKASHFFLSYGPNKPHVPWYVPKPFFDLYDLKTMILPEVLSNDLDDVPRPTASNHHQEEIIRTGNWARGVQAYLASSSFSDSCLGVVLNTLEASPYRDSTIVLIMGDHGWHLGEKLHWGKATSWEETTHTFFIMYDPTIAKPGIVDQTVGLQDVYPTLMDLTGNTAPTQVEGRSLRPILENPQNNDFLGWALMSYGPKRHTLRTDKWAIIRYADRPPAVDYELYNMFTDPLQHINLAKKAEYADVVTKLSADIDRITTGEDPVNTDIYGKAPAVGTKRIPGSKDKAFALPAHKIYRLKAFGVNGKLVREFVGRGPDIERMIALGGSGLDLPMGKYVYRVFDIQDKLVKTVSGLNPIR